ncbi:hypothetical protein CyaNS01_02254 [Cyanobium sp. NS01]|nr:hypothetical protein CyaNS01_02254 [Cyanobium sp. NS01]
MHLHVLTQRASKGLWGLWSELPDEQADHSPQTPCCASDWESYTLRE